jgi:hypothetical protein
MTTDYRFDYEPVTDHRCQYETGGPEMGAALYSPEPATCGEIAVFRTWWDSYDHPFFLCGEHFNIVAKREEGPPQ